MSVYRVALTGGIASGKSHCLERFAALGAPVIDADEIARAAVERGTPGLAEVVKRFGAAVLTPDGTLDRNALARIVFSDADRRRELEAIIHPRVYAAIERWFAELETWTGTRIGIADIPLLFEGGRARDFQSVIVAACRPDQQIARLVERRGLSTDEARRRVAAQAPLAPKMAGADFVIDTSGAIAETDDRVARVWHALRRRLHAEAPRKDAGA